MPRQSVRSLLLFVIVAALVVGCGGDSGPQPKPGEPPTQKQAEKEKMKTGNGAKTK